MNLHILKLVYEDGSGVRLFPLMLAAGMPPPDGAQLHSDWLDSWGDDYPDSDDEFMAFLESRGFTLADWTDETISA